MEKTEKILYENELNANQQMVKVCFFVGILLILIWFCYLFGLFPIADKNKLLAVLIALPIDAMIMFSGWILKRTSWFHHPGFKYFLIFSFLLIMAVLNVLIPKHAVLGWAASIVLTNHYYNPKLARITFILVLGLSLVCLYGGMLVGEYDFNLMGAGYIKFDENNNPYIYQAEGILDRIEQIKIIKGLEGKDLYLAAFLYYYLGRSFFIWVIYEISYRLNKRTFNLLHNQIAVVSANEKMETELKIASEIQKSVLPNAFKATDNVEILAGLKAAKEVGGDLYDYYLLDDNHIAFVIGDVSGKGTPAAMFMMKTITCLKNRVSLSKTPAEILQEVNRDIYNDDNNGMFVTCFFGILDTKTGLLKYANAGHNAPIIGKKHQFRYLDCKSGFVLGGFPEAIIASGEITLQKNDIIILYTDGITEARNVNMEFYGPEKFLDFVNQDDYSSLIELQYNVKNEPSSTLSLLTS